MDIGNRIKLRREELGYTQDELAKRLGYKSRSSVNKIENSREVSMKKIKLYANALDTTVPYLMGWEEKHAEIESADIDTELIMMERRLKEYAIKLSKLPKDKQEHIMSSIDMLER